MRKYNNQKTMYNGIKFDSKRELKRYQELKLLEASGEIKDLKLQVPFELIPSQFETYERYSDKTGKRLKNGKRCIEKACVYIADFVYTENGKTVVEDTKGFKTKDYIIKRKLMLERLNIRIREV